MNKSNLERIPVILPVFNTNLVSCSVIFARQCIASARANQKKQKAAITGINLDI